MRIPFLRRSESSKSIGGFGLAAPLPGKGPLQRERVPNSESAPEIRRCCRVSRAAFSPGDFHPLRRRVRNRSGHRVRAGPRAPSFSGGARTPANTAQGASDCVVPSGSRPYCLAQLATPSNQSQSMPGGPSWRSSKRQQGHRGHASSPDLPGNASRCRPSLRDPLRPVAFCGGSRSYRCRSLRKRRSAPRPPPVVSQISWSHS